MEFDMIKHFKELSKNAECEIIRMLNHYDSTRLFYALVASTYIAAADAKPSIHMEQHPVFLIEILGHFLFEKDFTGTDNFIYPEVLDELNEYLYQYSLQFNQFDSGDKFLSHIENQHAIVRGKAFCWQTKKRIYQVYKKI